MSWLKIGARFLQVGDVAEQALKSVTKKVSRLINEDGVSVLQALTLLPENENLEPDEIALIDALKKWAANVGEGEFGKLLTSLGDLEMQAELSDRQLGWPAKEWSVNVLDGDQVPVALLLKPEGGAYFEVFADQAARPPQVPSTHAFEAAAKIVLNGKITTQLSGDAMFSPVALNFGADAGIKRAATLHLSYPSRQTLAGVAVAGALARLRSPADFDAALSAFTSGGPGRLDAIVIEGDEHLGAEAAIKASVPTQYGTFGFNLGGAAQIGRDFHYVITAPETGDALAIDVKSGSKFTNEFEIGVSYSIGLSTLAPGVANALVGKIDGISETFDEIDRALNARLTDAQTWLKPGTLLKDKINENLTTLLTPGDQDNPEVVANLKTALAALFGFSGEADEALQPLVEHAGGLIAGLADDALGLVGGDGTAFSENIQTALRARIDEKALALLNEHVVSKIPVDLTDALQQLERDINIATKQAINAFFGLDGEAALKEIGEYIDAVREIVVQVTGALSKIQTELLAAEVGWRRERAKERRAEYRAVFSDGNDDAKKAYRKIILAPRKFGDLLTKPEQGVVIEELAAETKLFKSTGPRWSLALIGFALSGSKVTKSNIAILQTLEGADVVTGKVEIERKRKFLKEIRTVSFLSAYGLIEARAREPERELTLAEKNRIIENVSGARTAARIALDFEEDDNKIKTDEARRLLKRFVDVGMISERVSRDFQRAVDDARDEASDETLAGTMSLSIGVPSEQVENILKFAADNGQRSVDVAKTALLAHDPDSIDSAIRKSRALEVLAGGGEPPEGARGFGELTTSRSLQPISDVVRRGFLDEIDVLSRSFDETMIGAEIFPLEDMSPRAATARDLQIALRSEVKHLQEATQTLRSVLSKGAEIYFKQTLPEFGDQSERNQFTLWLEEEQRSMVKAAKPFLKTGTPLPNFFGGKAPKRTVALFAALQILSREATGFAPPLIVSLAPKGKTPVSFVEAAPIFQ